MKLIANDMVLMLEISILGAIALVPEVLFYRRDFGPVWTGDEAMAKTLLRVDPEASKRKIVRPFWELGMQQLVRCLAISAVSQRNSICSRLLHMLITPVGVGS